MKFYNGRIDTILDPFCRIEIPRCLGYIIHDSNIEGHLDSVTYRTNAGVSLCQDKITIEFPSHQAIINWINEDTGVITDVRQTTQHINPFSHYRTDFEKDIYPQREFFTVQRRTVPLGKFRIPCFKGVRK